MESIGYFAKALLHLFFPRNCIACNRPLITGEEMLCLNCNLELPRTAFHRNPDNPAWQKFTGRIPVQRATAFLYFIKEGLVQRLIHVMKYDDKKRLGHFLGTLFAMDLKHAGWLATVDLIIPVPLHPKKERQRGYNQAAYIAYGLSEASGIPVLKDCLLKIRHTPSQTHKSTMERIENVTGAFLLKKPELVSGKHVLLVDDVLTTGATLESCARALLSAKNSRVSIAALAIAAD